MSLELDSLRARQEQAGASFTEVAGHPVVRHYGDAAAEYAAVRGAAGVADRADLAQLRMWGRDPVRMLHGLITNDLLTAAEGQGVYAAMLTPKGRTLAELRAFVRRLAAGTEVLIDLPREALEGARGQLKKFVPPLFARWGEAGTGALGVYGPGADALLERVGAGLPGGGEDAFVEAAWREGPLLVARTLQFGEAGYDLFAPQALLPALWDALLAEGARPVGFEALETLRVEAGRPRYGRELTDETIPTEAFEAIGQMPRAVSFTKGCYTGQEVIVRIAHRGHVNRHLRGLLLGDAPPPPDATALLHPETGREVGRVTSAVASPRLGQTLALGYLRREVAPGETVRLATQPPRDARVAALPFSEEDHGGG